MEIIPTKSTPELVSLTASTLQTTRFKERKTREVQSDVKNEAIYYSPVIKIDRETATAVLQYRDSKTGEVKNQYPNVPHGVDAYEQAQNAAPKQEAEKVPEKAAVETNKSPAQPAPKAEAPKPAPVPEKAEAEHIDQDA